jgi:peptidoglycan/xylan/chitin deacetylase (PgdA/CDA1 family)
MGPRTATRAPVVALLASLGACSPPSPPAATPAPAPTASAAASPLPSGAGPLRVAVTVDDLPSHGPLVPGQDRESVAAALLDAFKRHRLPPVYGFVNGKRVDEEPANEEVLRMWVASGNPLGNHGYSHIGLLDHTVADYLADVARGEAILEKTTPGGAWRFFRYPFLYEGDTKDKRAPVRAWLKEHGYTVAEVTIDADDWAYNPPRARCLQKKDGAMLAELHDDFVREHVEELRRVRDLTRALAGRDVAHVLLLHVGVADADAIEDLLTAYEHEGVAWVGLPDALSDPFYALDPDPVKGGPAFPYAVATWRGVTLPARPVYARGVEERLEKTCR